MVSWNDLLLIVVGCVAGILNVLAGGGSLIILPMLIFLGLDGATANGSSRVAVLIQNCSAVGGFRRKGYSDFKLSLSLGLAATPGAIIGALAGVRLEGVWFNRVLAGVMMGVLIWMTIGSRRVKGPIFAEAGEKPAPKNHVLAHALMFGAGFYGGFIQAGVGFLLMPILHKVLGFDLVRTNMHKVFVVAVYMVPALIVYTLNGKVLWRTGLVLALGTALGGWLGSHVAVGKGDVFIRRIFILTLVAMAIRLALY